MLLPRLAQSLGFALSSYAAGPNTTTTASRNFQEADLSGVVVPLLTRVPRDMQSQSCESGKLEMDRGCIRTWVCVVEVCELLIAFPLPPSSGCIS